MVLVRNPSFALFSGGRAVLKILDEEFAFQGVCFVPVRKSESCTDKRVVPRLQGIYVEERSESVVLLTRHLNRTVGN